MSTSWEVSQHQLERLAYRRRRDRTRMTIALVSTVVALVALSLLVTSAPGWDRVRETYFDWADAQRTFPEIAKAFVNNIKAFVIAEILILALGMLVAVVRVVPSAWTAPLKLVATVYTDVFRGTPTLLVVLLIGFGVPTLGLQGTPTDVFWLGIIALTLSYGAYVAEVIRAGILSVHASQWASGRALGLSYGKTLRYVVLPQALRRVTPPLLNDFVSLQDLTVDTHQVVCLIGASGSGKSTLLRCLNLLEVVDDGEIWFDGREITDPRVDVDEVRREIGIVFQAYNLFPHLSVLDNVTLGPRKARGVRRGEAQDRAMTLLTRFGLADQARKHPDALSGGQQQRVAIVRALAMDPKSLLLDEVTSALDPQLVGEVLEAVRELKDAGMTIVMATHEMQFACEVADDVLFLDDGVVRERGTAEQVFTAPVEARTREFLARHLG